MVKSFATLLEAFVVRHRQKIPFIHGGMFLLFVALIFIPPFTPVAQYDATVWSNYRLFANMMIWGLWFPLVFLSTLVLGRSWCGLFCPLGAMAEWVNKRGKKKSIPAWIRWPGTSTISFILVTIWGQTIGVRDHVDSMMIFFSGMTVAALVISVFYGKNKRAWCRHVCPIGWLLGVYARLGVMELRPKRLRPQGDRWTEKTVCPTMIDVNRKAQSLHCINCFRCVQPKAQGGLTLAFRSPGYEVENIRHFTPSLAEVVFLFLGAGAALGGFAWLALQNYQTLRMSLAELALNHGWLWFLKPGSPFLMAVYPDSQEVFTWLDASSIALYILGWAVFTFVLLAAVTLISAWLTGPRQSLKQRFIELGYQFAPVSMVSLLLGLGAGLFVPLTPSSAIVVKMAFLLLASLWSLRLSWKLLARQHVRRARLFLAWLPSVAGTAFLLVSWGGVIL